MKALRTLAPAAAGLGGWFALSVALGAATVAAAVGLMGAAGWLITTAALMPPLSRLQIAIVGVRFFGLARAAARYAERLVSHHLALELLERLRGWLLDRLEPLAPGRLVELRSADLLARVVGDVESLEQLTVRGLSPPAVAAATVLGVGVVVGAVDPGLGAAAAAVLLVAAVGVPAAVLAAARRPGRRAAVAGAELTAATVDAVQGIAELVAWRRADDRLEQLRGLAGRRSTAELGRVEIAALGGAAVQLLAHGTPWLLVVLGLPRIADGSVDGVGLAVAALVALAGFEALEPLPAAAAALERQEAAAERVLEVVSTPPAVTGPASPEVVAPVRPADHTVAVAWRDVRFTYPGAARPALDGFSLEVDAGSRVAVLGPSGAGKSTVARLLARTWDPEEGVVAMAGVDVRRWRLEALRRTVVVLGQATRLFAGSLRDNLLLAAPDADDDRLAAACRAAGLDDVLDALPAGLDSWIGEHGATLSGGERRRLEIARTWLADPAVVVLDEPTAHLDPATESRILAGLLELFEGRTAVVITHRLRVAERIGRVAMLERGRVAEAGDVAALARGDGRYARWRRLETSRITG